MSLQGTPTASTVMARSRGKWPTKGQQKGPPDQKEQTLKLSAPPSPENWSCTFVRGRTVTVVHRTDAAHLKQLFRFLLFFRAAHPSARMAEVNRFIKNCRNNVLELFLQPPFLSTLSLSEYSEAILF